MKFKKKAKKTERKPRSYEDKIFGMIIMLEATLHTLATLSHESKTNHWSLPELVLDKLRFNRLLLHFLIFDANTTKLKTKVTKFWGNWDPSSHGDSSKWRLEIKHKSTFFLNKSLLFITWKN